MNNSDNEIHKWLATSLTAFRRAFRNHSDKDYPAVIYNAQQCIEFCLKALILSYGVIPKRSHDPGRQLLRIEANETNERLKQISALMVDHYFRSRYPENDFPYQAIQEDNSKETLALVIETLEKTLKQISNQRKIEIGTLMEKCITLLPETLQKETEDLIHEKLST